AGRVGQPVCEPVHGFERVISARLARGPAAAGHEAPSVPSGPEDASLRSCALSPGSETEWAVARRASRTASESGFGWPDSVGKTGSGGTTFTTSDLASSPAAAAASSRASACSRSLAFQTGELTIKTSLFSSTLASRHWLARVAGRLRRSIGSSAASQRARSTRPARPVPDSASSACRGSEDGAAPPYGLDGSDMMNVIIAANFLKAPKKLSFDQPRVVAAALGSLLLLLGLGFGIGYLSRGADGAARAELAGLRATGDQQQLALDQAREDAQLEINALAARVGELQAQANRLNALGDRLTRVGKLKDGEFNFSALPGQG